MIKWRSQYNDPERDQLIAIIGGVACSAEEDMTVQAHKEEADINTMLHRYGITGTLNAPATQPFYGDFSEAVDFHGALNAIKEAEAEFEALPSSIRNRFRNDPGALLDFINNPDNLDEARELGLVDKAPAEPEPSRVIIVSPEEDTGE